MRPMHNAAFGVPLVFTIKGDIIPFPEVKNSRGKVNVVGNKQGLTGREPQDKALVATAVVVIWQDLADNAAACRLHPASVFCNGSDQNRIALPRKTRGIIGAVELTPAKIDGQDEGNYRD